MPRHPPCALSSLTVKLTREQRSRENLSVPNYLLAQQLALLQSLFNCQRTKITFDQGSKLQPSIGRPLMFVPNTRLPGLSAQVTMSVSNLRSRFEISNPNFACAASKAGGGEGIRTPDPRVANAVLCQLSYTPDKISNSEIRISKFKRGWLRGRDLNPRPLGYEPNELPDCSTPHLDISNRSPQGQTTLPDC